MTGTKEKATASALSVGADNKQSLSNIITNSLPDDKLESNNILNIEDEIYRQRFLQMNSADYLHTVSHTELLDTTFKPREQVIDGLLCAGTYLFAGAPKIGKSFFMAQLGYHVSSGIPLWECHCHQGTVLYLALEDDYARLQKRLSRMYGTDSVDGLHFATHAKNLNEGLDGQLKSFIKNNSDTKLIIIDTLQKVREASAEKFSYASDYEVVTKLKNFSDEYNICILLVHHTRKQAAEDSFETISGTNGLLGAADGAFIMHKDKRTTSTAILDVVGRDQQDQKLNLMLEPERCVWRLTERESKLWKEPTEPLLEAVAKLLTAEAPEWAGSASELLERLEGIDIQPNILTRRLNVNADRLWNEYSIRLETSRNRDGRLVRLSLDRS